MRHSLLIQEVLDNLLVERAVGQRVEGGIHCSIPRHHWVIVVVDADCPCSAQVMTLFTDTHDILAKPMHRVTCLLQHKQQGSGKRTTPP